MHVHKIVLKDVRGFDLLEFDLSRPDGTYAGWTVFTGDNGSGKSTLLKAIAMCVTGRDTARALQPDLRGWIRQDAKPREASIEVEITPVVNDDKASTRGAPMKKSFSARLHLQNGGRDVSLSPDLPAGQPDSQKIPKKTIWSMQASGWFCCGYGPFRRVFGASSDAMQQMVSPSTARFATMFHEAASLAQADAWLRDIKYKAVEGKEGFQKQLDVALSLLRDDLMPNEITVDRVDSDGLWLRDRQGVTLSWSEMSDGYRAAVALLLDIVRHLIDAYGVDDLLGKNEDGRLFITRSGVVLIDEIDAHLHPEWQRTIGFWLKRRFPKIQFLVTTHSPIICQAADPNGLFVLPEPGSDDRPRQLSEEEYREVVTSRPDTILLSPAFGLEATRSPIIVEKRARLAQLNAKARSGTSLSAQETTEQYQLSAIINNDEEL